MAPRSRTGCLTCRSRKLKCSEERPICAQCQKAGRECIPSLGITFRHQQNPSMNGDLLAEGSLKRFYGYKETFDDRTVWLPVPQGLTFVHTSNPYEDEEEHGTGGGEDSAVLASSSLFESGRGTGELSLSQALYPQYPTHGLEALSAVASQDQYNYAPVPSGTLPHEIASSALETTLANSAATDSQSLEFMLNSSAALPSPTNLDPRLQTPARSQSDLQEQAQSPHHVRTSSYSSARPSSLLSQGKSSLSSATVTAPTKHRPATALRDRELAFFLRDFSERAGHWMDIFDLNCFFGVHVPVLAAQCPLLLYSCAALSAKSLSRISGRRSISYGQPTVVSESKMQVWPGHSMAKEDWIRKGREYYDMAISLLRQSLRSASRPHTSDIAETASPQTVSPAQGIPLPSTDSDELIAATAVLCVYEFLDASGAEWSRHLDGAKSLFDVARDSMVSLALPSSPSSAAQHLSPRLSARSERPAPSLNPLSQGRHAVFWNFARQDMLSAFIEGTSTRFDASDLSMWQSAGLKMTPGGTVRPSNPQRDDFDQHEAMQDDMICNALIWLLARLVNFINAREPRSPLSTAAKRQQQQQQRYDEWRCLDDHFRRWFEGLPDTFHPTAAITYNEAVNAMTEQWFPRSMCASTMQSYHFARIQLLHHKPQPTRSKLMTTGISLGTRHEEYAQLLQQTRHHAKEIVRIELSKDDEGARVHAVQPLWTAGLVLGGQPIDDGDGTAQQEMHGWRCTIVSQLRAIERDMGWAAEYRVQSLLRLWNLPSDWRPDLVTDNG